MKKSTSRASSTTNVSPSQLNYDHYASSRYDRDIVRSIPHHRELHFAIMHQLRKVVSPMRQINVLDLGVGTGITSALIKQDYPQATFDVVDFSRTMLAGARRRLGQDRVRYIFGDYSKIRFVRKYDVVISVIGFHHQTDIGKKKMIQKIFGLLKPGGVLLLGDLMTYRDPKKAAMTQALHFHHLVEHAASKASLAEWAHHHITLNMLAPFEQHVAWMRAAGFSIEVPFMKLNTALVIAMKPA